MSDEEVFDDVWEVDGRARDEDVVSSKGNHVTMTIRFRDMERTNLFLWEVSTLIDEMRVMASPHAVRLERLVGRWAAGGDDEGEA